MWGLFFFDAWGAEQLMWTEIEMIIKPNVYNHRCLMFFYDMFQADAPTLTHWLLFFEKSAHAEKGTILGAFQDMNFHKKKQCVRAIESSDTHRISNTYMSAYTLCCIIQSVIVLENSY